MQVNHDIWEKSWFGNFQNFGIFGVSREFFILQLIRICNCGICKSDMGSVTTIQIWQFFGSRNVFITTYSKKSWIWNFLILTTFWYLPIRQLFKFQIIQFFFFKLWFDIILNVTFFRSFGQFLIQKLFKFRNFWTFLRISDLASLPTWQIFVFCQNFTFEGKV